MAMLRSSLPLKTVIVYVFWATAWILLSDQALAWIEGSRPGWTHLASLKGLLLVLVTGFLLYHLLRRVMNRMEARDWPRIWDQAGGEFFDGPGSNDDYPRAQGRMIAAKNDPVWTLISRFGTPWPPFDWGSGMGLRGIDREEAEALGVIDPADVVLPLSTPFNRELEASLIGIAPARRSAIAESMAGDVSIDGDRLRAVAPETTCWSRPKTMR